MLTFITKQTLILIANLIVYQLERTPIYAMLYAIYYLITHKK